MTYDPKIYIRGYATPTHRILAFTGAFGLTGNDVDFFRHLVMQAEGAQPEEYILLSGDEQSGTDLLEIDGADLLVLSGGASFRLFGPDVSLVYGVDRLPVDTGEFALTGIDVAFDEAGGLLFEGDMQDGADVLLLSGDAQTGADIVLTSIGL